MSSSYASKFVDYNIEDADPKDTISVINIEHKNNLVSKILQTFLKQRNITTAKVSSKIAIGATDNRLLNRIHAVIFDAFDDEGKQPDILGRKSGPLLSGAAYCFASCSMILLNKVILSNYDFAAGVSLMLYQNLICVMVVLALRFSGVVSMEKLTWKLIRVWLPVNFIFVGMLVTGMYSLKYINVAMVTILKNMTNILTATGEIYLFRRHHSKKVWAALLLMVVSAVSGGITDLSFNVVGYTWQVMNCILTASYSLILRRVMDTAKQVTESGSLNEISMVLLNNLLSIPFAVFLIILFNEWQYVSNVESIRMPMFWVAATASGLFGLAISFASMWFLNQTGPTTYSLIGSLNKIPISIAGLVLFKVPVSTPNLFSIFFGLVAGVFFAKAKMS